MKKDFFAKRRARRISASKPIKAVEISCGQSSMFCADREVALAWIEWHHARGVESILVGNAVVDREEVTSNKP